MAEDRTLSSSLSCHLCKNHSNPQFTQRLKSHSIVSSSPLFFIPLHISSSSLPLLLTLLLLGGVVVPSDSKTTISGIKSTTPKFSTTSLSVIDRSCLTFQGDHVHDIEDELDNVNDEESGSGFNIIDDTTVSASVNTVATTHSTVSTKNPVVNPDPKFCQFLTCSSPQEIQDCPVTCASKSPTKVPTKGPTATAPTRFESSRCNCVMIRGGIWQYERCYHGCFARDETACNGSSAGCESIIELVDPISPPLYSNCQCQNNPNMGDICSDYASENCCESSAVGRELCPVSCGTCNKLDPPKLRPTLNDIPSPEYQQALVKCVQCVTNGGVLNSFVGSSVTPSQCLRGCFASDLENCFDSENLCVVFAELQQSSTLCSSPEANTGCEACVETHVGCAWVWSDEHLQGSCIDASKDFPFTRETCHNKVFSSDPNRICTPPTMSPTTSPSWSPTLSHPTVAPTSAVPTMHPTFNPTVVPSILPTVSPSHLPSTSPTYPYPSGHPTTLPTLAPRSMDPTPVPTVSYPTTVPSSSSPTFMPSRSPTATYPSLSPTTATPSAFPTSAIPSANPSVSPSDSPTTVCSTSPCFNGGICHLINTSEPQGSDELIEGDSGSGAGGDQDIVGMYMCECQAGYTGNQCEHTVSPTITPSRGPTFSNPSMSPTFFPSVSPATSVPTSSPSLVPSTAVPTFSPTMNPTTTPTSVPTLSCYGLSEDECFRIDHCLATYDTSTSQYINCTETTCFQIVDENECNLVEVCEYVGDQCVGLQLTLNPSAQPTHKPSKNPSSSPPSLSPSTPAPTSLPSQSSPTISPSLLPSTLPTFMPSDSPTMSMPTHQPSFVPTRLPSHLPTYSPSVPFPSSFPTFVPSTSTPTTIPTLAPQLQPTATTTGTTTTVTSVTTSTIDYALINASSDVVMSSRILITVIVGVLAIVLLVVVIIMWRSQQKALHVAPQNITPVIGIGGKTIPTKDFAKSQMLQDPNTGVLVFDSQPHEIHHNPAFDPDTFEV